MIKICHITSTPQKFIPRLLRESSTAIKMGIEPYVISQGETFKKNGVTFIGVPTSKNRLSRMIFTCRRLFQEALKVDADIYQIHDPELLPFALKLKKADKKVIFDSHEFYGIQIETKEYIPKSLRHLVSKIYKKYETYVCKKIDAVIAICTVNNENYFEKRANKTVFIANMPDSNIFVHDNEKSGKKIKYVVYVGALSQSRGVTNIIKAVAKTKAALILCGPFNSKEYEREIKKLPEFKGVKYKGVVSRNKVANILKESYIGISTLLHIGQYSEIDTLATKIYEYMAVGLPVIISNTKFAKGLISRYKFGICVDPKNIDEIAEKINFLLENPTVAQQMGEKGKKLIKYKYNWEIEEKKLITLYKQLLTNHTKLL